MDKDNNSPSARQQISEQIKEVSSILITVSKNPTVDELSAALALTLILNKLDKHATAVFSGVIPPAIDFLEPDKTLENNVDSLRDFIIAIDKEKADRLRYKVEGDVVRIFITPYKTHISEQDLEFTHGDFNVELVLALDVENQDVLDEAITAHGKILHDATVATINAQGKTSTLGSIDWQDENASSLCEMLVSLGESLKTGLLDEQIATALLTGIVAATDRFSNKQTTSKSMTIAAQLMAAGANQQLIATKLENASEISVSGKVKPDGSVELDEGRSGRLRKENRKDQKDNKSSESLGQIHIDHRKKAESSQDDQQSTPTQSATIEEHDKINKQNAGEEALDVALEKLGANTKPTAQPLAEELEKSTKTVAKPEKSPLIGESKPSGVWSDPNIQEPSMGSSLNATIQEAVESKQHTEETGRNKTILSHNNPSNSQEIDQNPKPEPTPTVVDDQSATGQQQSNTLADVEANIGAHNQNLADTSGGDLPPVPLPPLPDFSSLPPLPPTTNPQPLETTTVPSTIPPPQKVPVPSEPGQFKIPGQ